MKNRYEVIEKADTPIKCSRFADTLKEAYEIIASYERYDKIVDNYKPNSYKIIDKQFNIVLE